MNDSTLNFYPSWNEDITRKQYIFNHLAMIALWAVLGVMAGFVSALIPDLSAAIFTAFGIGVAIGSLILSLLWMNNRLRDSGLASEGWRVFLIILSILSGIVGCIVLLYCSVKPTEHPSEQTVEDDDDCRDEGPR